jgi:threonine dehydrogenase-like Zn-dependent dehydrogenase
MPETARIVVQTAPEQYELRDVPIPDPGPDGAILRVEACGVCGTDLEVFHAEVAIALFPLVPGHEPLGVIERIGDDARRRWRLEEGDRVAVKSAIGCGRCVLCTRGAGCVEFTDGRIPNFGFQSPERAPGLWGGFATHLYLPPQAQFQRFDPTIPTSEAATFNALANGLQWVEVGGVRPGQTVVVFGPGPRGLACVIGARRAGADRVVVTGLARDSHKLELARDLGADAALVVEPDAVVEAVLEQVPGGADVVIDATPVAVGPVADAVRIAKRRGTIVLAGMKGRNTLSTVLADDLLVKELSLRGTGSTSLSSMIDAVRLIESRRLPIDRIATHSFPLEEAAAAVQALEMNGAGDAPIHIHLAPA